ncbi:MAG: putative secreted protein, periplasmic copper-binding protein (NosD) family [Parcubacteria group bacterium GW2011_GWE2_38_18]|nr:MAG: putative secreted protein, periplasmic copper-binding protein (NosD) family [Parcubacteria group bacterium GW2011_GWE2_38_18]
MKKNKKLKGSKIILFVLLSFILMSLNILPTINVLAADETSTSTAATSTEAVQEQSLTGVVAGPSESQQGTLDGVVQINPTSTSSITNNNQADLVNGIDTNASTSDNAIANTVSNPTSTSTPGSNGSSTGSTIDTGNIDIANAVINLVNNNIIGSGVQYLVNIFKNLIQDIDLSGGGQSTPSESLNITNSNASTINNKIVIKADTGENIIASSTGPSLIQTGDIKIANDVINMANLNIVGNGWFFAVVNIFGELDGDIVLPAMLEEESAAAASTTESNLSHPRHQRKIRKAATEFLITNKNNTELNNNINVNANTGDNTISSSTYQNIIKTGSVNANVNAFNLVNYNVYSNSWKFCKINIYGTWDGVIQGLPAGYGYFEDENGVTIYEELSDYEKNQLYSKFLLSNDNNASTTNSIEIDANTGKNLILDGSGEIKTGNIDITNNILNFINSNFIGDNWQFSLINVFGNWKGNLAFGKPDLWITQSNLDKKSLSKGETITYTILYGNKGDSSATDAKLKCNLDARLAFTSDANNLQTVDNVMTWSLGKIPPNTQGSITYTVFAKDLPAGEVQSTSKLNISATESDRDLSNNSLDSLLNLKGGQNSSGGSSSGSSSGGGGGSSAPRANLAVLKTNDTKGAVHPGDIVNYKITIKNTGNSPLDNVKVADAISNINDGQELGQNIWDLGAIQAGEEINIDYALEIKDNIKSGIYINQATVKGYDQYQKKFVSALASSKIKIDNLNQSGKLSRLAFGRISKKLTAKPGEKVEQELIVTNNSLQKIDKVNITEKLPKGFTFEDKKTSKTWTLENIEPGKIKNIKYNLLVDKNAKQQTYSITTTADTDKNEMPLNLIFKLKVQEQKVLGTKINNPTNVKTAKTTLPKTLAKAKTQIKKSPVTTNLKNTVNKVNNAPKKVISLPVKLVSAIVKK